LEYVEGDARLEANEAVDALQREIGDLQDLDVDVFATTSRVREHVRRLEPKTEKLVASTIRSIRTHRNKAIKNLKARSKIDGEVDTEPAVTALQNLNDQIESDIKRLRSDDPATAIASLEHERQTLRHREVLKKLLRQITAFVNDAAWCAKAQRAKSALNPRHVTNKENELFMKIVGHSYKSILAQECEELDCELPIELQTVGKRGETVRSLSMKGGHKPDIILSEGEQKAVALADFLTEVTVNPSSASIVLDDPVTSQDHERKGRIATRLVEVAKYRQVIVFTHDLPFLNQVLSHAEKEALDYQAHWVDRDVQGNPGQITHNDAPATNKFYDTAEKAKQQLSAAKKLTGSAQVSAIRDGMGALRRTIEETIAKRLLKGVIPRWDDRVIVTGLRKVNWDEALVEELCVKYEALSGFIEGHSHTDEAAGAPPTVADLANSIDEVEKLIRDAKREKAKSGRNR